MISRAISQGKSCIEGIVVIAVGCNASLMPYVQPERMEVVMEGASRVRGFRLFSPSAAPRVQRPKEPFAAASFKTLTMHINIPEQERNHI
jgi:hypothetical protein